MQSACASAYVVDFTAETALVVANRAHNCRFGHTALIGSVDGFQLTRDDVYCVMLTLLCVLAGPPTPATSQVPPPMGNLHVIYEYITRAKIDTPPIW
jgi:hypothetical protein